MMDWVPADMLAPIWFVLLGVLLIGYAILDGFDLGVGIVHLTAKTDHDRRVSMNSIGPLWDGNEVWLVTFGGAMFAAFPEAYATVFGGFMIPLMLVLYCLIMRAVSLEFRSKRPGKRWRRVWDFAFFGSSLGAALLFGVASGNILQGVPLGQDREIRMGLFEMLSPYPVTVGLMTVAMLGMHGALFLNLKTGGDQRERLRALAWRLFFAFVALFVVVSAWTLVAVPHALENMKAHPWLYAVPLLNVLAIANIPRALNQRRPAYAFLSSCCAIAAFCFLLMTALFPDLVVSSIDPAYSLSVTEAASSEGTLRTMLTIAVVGLPFVFAYSGAIYWTFWGRTELGENSY